MDFGKNFDSAEKILEELKKEKILPEHMYLSFINSIYDILSRSTAAIYGASAKDFFIQGLIAITGDIESFKVALEYFINLNY